VRNLLTNLGLPVPAKDSRYSSAYAQFIKTIIALIRVLHKAGNSLRQIARKLEARGYRTKTGQIHWHPQSVKQILKREAA